MSAIPFLSPINLNQNELLQAVLQNLATAPTVPTPVTGQLYFDTTAIKPYYYDGTKWVDFYGGIEQITADNGLSFTSGTGTDAIVHLQVNVDNSTLEISSDTVQVKNNGITYSKIQQVASLKVLGNNTGAAANVIEIPLVTVLPATLSDTSLATVKAIRDAISAAVTNVGTFVGGLDATTGYPTVGSNGPIKKGDYWVITVSGTLGANVVEIGDVLYAYVDTPSITVDADWFVVQHNVVQATETISGYAKIATATQVTTGTDDSTIVTPKKLNDRIIELGGTFNSHKKEFTITGDSATLAFALTHSLNTLNVDCTFVETATPFNNIIVNWQATDVNTVTVNFSKAVATGTVYRGTIIG